MLNTKVYPACINLRGRRCLVVGAGPIALEKIRGLLDSDARVRVVAPEAVAEIRLLAAEGSVDWRRRTFDEGDLDDCFLAIAATSTPAVNRRVYEAAEARSRLVNVVDVPELCNFILPAIVRRGPLAIAISTSGASPALAKRIKAEIAASIDDNHARLARILDEHRAWAKENLATYRDRKDFFEAIVNGDPDPIALLELEGETAVHALIAARKRAAVRPTRDQSDAAPRSSAL